LIDDGVGVVFALADAVGVHRSMGGVDAGTNSSSSVDYSILKIFASTDSISFPQDSIGCIFAHAVSGVGTRCQNQRLRVIANA
jgi:hypothetical protein